MRGGYAAPYSDQPLTLLLRTTTITTSTTITSTETDAAISTSTVTSTQTISTSTSVYAACAQTNMADRYNGQGIYSTSTNNDFGPEININAASPYDCCAAAFTYHNGIATIWAFYQDNGGSNCYIETENSCPNGQGQFTWSALLGQSGSTPVVLGNGYCGEVNSAS